MHKFGGIFGKMSCNGCRVLRKGCSDSCILRSCLQWIESPEAQGHATVFVAKFFGRAGMLSFISAVSESQRPALFQSLLYEACGRTVNPVFGAVGLLWGGNWGICQAAVETILKGGSLSPALCLPSSKPIQPLISQALLKKSALKRPQNMPDTSTDINAEAKRLRSAEHPDFKGKAGFSIDLISKPEMIGNTKVLEQEERPSQSGQLVAPVARRVKPRAPFGVTAIGIREATGCRKDNMDVQEYQQAFEEQERQSCERVELGLTLNSHSHHENGKGTEQRFKGDMRSYIPHPLGSRMNHGFVRFMCNEEDDGAARASSPCSFSLNSEGSVISSDSAEFSRTCVRALSSPRARNEECQLLHLL